MKIKRSQVKRLNQLKRSRAKTQSLMAKSKVSFTSKQVFLLLGLLAFSVSIYVASGVASGTEEHVAEIILNKTFWLAFGCVGIAIFSAITVVVYIKAIKTNESAAIFVFVSIISLWAVATTTQLVARYANRMAPHEPGSCSERKILELTEVHARRHSSRITGYRAKVMVGNRKVSVPVSYEIFEATTAGGCIDVCISPGALGFDYIYDVGLPKTLRSRVKCVTNDEWSPSK